MLAPLLILDAVRIKKYLTFTLIKCNLTFFCSGLGPSLTMKAYSSITIFLFQSLTMKKLKENEGNISGRFILGLGLVLFQQVRFQDYQRFLNYPMRSHSSLEYEKKHIFTETSRRKSENLVHFYISNPKHDQKRRGSLRKSNYFSDIDSRNLTQKRNSGAIENCLKK